MSSDQQDLYMLYKSLSKRSLPRSRQRVRMIKKRNEQQKYRMKHLSSTISTQIKKTLEKNYVKIHPGVPWVTSEMISINYEMTNKSKKIFSE